ncbi:MAG TPA: carboxypeptidase-like regulatory domain-containing protein [Candidatus Binatia bacterium]|nr:carboxypeptidase-like regulatory domain-containing protein [Candidatus Binatia bacterium]
MKTRNGVIIGLCSLLAGLGLTSVAGAGFLDQPEAPPSAGISCMSGGIGEEERDTLSELGQSYDLKLIFADTTGHYLSDVTVEITDERGHQVLEAVSHGPWFFANLPAGRYHVRATTLGSPREQVIQVSPQHQVRLAFSWPEPGSRFAKEERF